MQYLNENFELPSKIALIVIDIDGTLLDSENRVSAGAEEMIKKALEKGLMVSLCSGRGNLTVKPFMKKLGLRHPYIVSGGAAIIGAYCHTVLEQHPLTLEQMHSVEEIGRHAGCGMLAHTTETLYGELPDFIWDKISAWEWVHGEATPPIQRVQKISHIFDQPIIRMDYFAEKSMLTALHQNVEKTGLTAIKLTHNIEISAPGVNKGSSLHALAQILGISLEQVLAVGDGVNDAPMLSAAGIGVALSNGAQSAFSAANYLAPSNDEGGLAWTLQKFLG